MKEKMLKRYRTFKHNLNYKEDYFRNLLIVLLIILIIDLMILYMLWW